MRLELELNWRHLAIAVVLFSAGTGLGYTVNGQVHQKPTSSALSYPTELHLTEADQNLVIAAGLIGHCEKLGLVSSVFMQDFNGVQYGVPICVQGGEKSRVR